MRLSVFMSDLRRWGLVSTVKCNVFSSCHGLNLIRIYAFNSRAVHYRVLRDDFSVFVDGEAAFAGG